MDARFLCVVPLLAAAAGCGGSHEATPPSSKTSAGGSLAAPAPRLDPYKAGVAYARCMRAHGVPHPDPDANGDFHLTPAQDRAMHTATTKPLSRGAQRAALVPLGEVRSCMRGFGYQLGKPIVKNMSRGRAMFGFEYA